MFQGMGKATIPLNNDLGFDASTVDVMVLSHAHIDHSGLIPKLVKEGFRGKIYCTPATKDLTGILLEDSAHIQENEVRYVNKKRAAEGQPYVQPLYTLDDAKKATERLTEVKYNEWKTIEQGVELLFTDAGHIIGSACVHLRITDNGKTESLTFSGDIGRYRDIILRSPDIFPQADYIIMESTYGNSLHEMQFTTPNHLLEWVERTCVQKKGKLIIPAFSVGRTQEILFALNQLELENRLPKVDYFLDSPLSIEATDIIKSYHHKYCTGCKSNSTHNCFMILHGFYFINKPGLPVSCNCCNHTNKNTNKQVVQRSNVSVRMFCIVLSSMRKYFNQRSGIKHTLSLIII